jgi:hypothetical protein
VYDVAGNVTKIFSEYVPEVAVIHPIARDFPTGDVTGVNTVHAYDTLINKGEQDFTFYPLYFGTGDSTVFSIDSIVTTPLVAGEKRAVKFGFRPKNTQPVWATIFFGDGCVQQEVLLRGIGGGASFSISNVNFGHVTIDSPKTDTAYISNTSAASPLTITSAFADSSEFTVLPNQLPIAVAPGTKKALFVKFIPSYCAAISSAIHMSSTEAGGHDGALKGAGACAGVEQDEPAAITSVRIDQSGLIHITLANTPLSSSRLDVVDLLGRTVLSVPITQTLVTIDSRSLRDGVYFYRLLLGDSTVSAKMAIWR